MPRLNFMDYRLSEDQVNEILSNPTTLKIFICFKINLQDNISVRKLQQMIGVKSSSTISWHLKKLEEAKLLIKNSSRHFILTEFGKQFNEFQYPISKTAQIIRGQIIPKPSLLLSILFFSMMFNLIVVIIGANTGIIIINSLLIGIISFSIVVRDWNSIRKQFQLSID